MSDTILFTSDKITLYLLSDIYDPVTNPEGTVIPRPGSLVLDVINNGLLRRVVSVHPTTFVVTYGPVHTALLAPEPPDLDPTDTNIVSIIDYGNSRFYLFYDKAEDPTKLNVDKKVIILGDDAVSYELNRFDAGLQRYIPISLYYDTDGTYRGSKVPLAVISTASNAKIPTNCHTTMPIEDEDVIHMFIFDYAGTQCGSIKLYAKRAIINNALEDDLIIEDMVIEATQIDNEGLYLFPDQDPLSLVLVPRLIYNNGSSKGLSIDNEVCHLYGLEGFTAAYPGQSVDVLVKYFLAPTQQAVGPTLHVAGSTRFLMKQMKLNVKDPGTNEYRIKILTVPVYLPSVSRWTLMFYLYAIGDTMVRNITPQVQVSPSFDGRLMGVDQALVLNLRIRDVYPDAATDFYYQQPVVVRLAPYDFYERYIIRDTVGDTYGIYGVDSPILGRPVIYFDETIEKYFVPTSKFGTEDMFVEAFYSKIRPLYDTGWLTVPPRPTHFTIRDAVSGMVVVSTPIALDGYGQSWSLVNVPFPNHLLGTNCIVEFLRYENNQYVVLFGAPVDVHPGVFI